MTKKILITGATDGIGLETAKRLYSEGHTLLLHGRNAEKLEATEVDSLAKAITKEHEQLDVIINNAGVMRVPETITQDGLDVRFAVNTVAPYLLTKHLLTILRPGSRVVNLSSAAQAPVELDALRGKNRLLDDMSAYAQSKLALTMWNNAMAASLGSRGPVFVAVNPGSLLASKMVKEGFGVAGKSLSIGADVLARAALSDEFANASGHYFDNDKGQFGPPHSDALNEEKCAAVLAVIEELVGREKS